MVDIVRVAINCAGFNHREEILNEKLIQELNLNPIQVFQIKSGKEVKVSDVTFIWKIN